MATQTTPFQGTKFYIGKGVEAEKSITACEITPNAKIIVANSGYKKRGICSALLDLVH